LSCDNYSIINYNVLCGVFVFLLGENSIRYEVFNHFFKYIYCLHSY